MSNIIFFAFSGWGVSSSVLAHRPTANRNKLVMIPTTRAGTAKIGIKVGRPATLCRIGPETTGYLQNNTSVVKYLTNLFVPTECCGVREREGFLLECLHVQLGAPKEDSGDHTTSFFPENTPQTHRIHDRIYNSG